MKRVLDVAFVTVAAPVWIPILLVVAVLVEFHSDPRCSSARAGPGSAAKAVSSLIKFRTMKKTRPGRVPCRRRRTAERLTSVGRVASAGRVWTKLPSSGTCFKRRHEPRRPPAATDAIAPRLPLYALPGAAAARSGQESRAGRRSMGGTRSAGRTGSCSTCGTSITSPVVGPPHLGGDVHAGPESSVSAVRPGYLCLRSARVTSLTWSRCSTLVFALAELLQRRKRQPQPASFYPIASITGRVRNVARSKPSLRRGAARGTPFALTNGTTDLDLALHALGIGSGDEVIVTPRTFLASVSSVITAGATPVFADVDRDSGNLSPRTIEAALTPRTRAIIPVHLGGGRVTCRDPWRWRARGLKVIGIALSARCRRCGRPDGRHLRRRRGVVVLPRQDHHHRRRGGNGHHR